MSKASLRRAARGAAAAVLIGAPIESLALAAGAYGYAGGWAAWWIPPWWVLAFWGLLGATVASLPAARRPRPRTLALCGGTFGPLGFAALARLGAARFLAPPAVGAALVCVLWAFALPLVTITLWRSERPRR